METSIALMAEQLTVKFIDIQDRYPCNEDIECKYSFVNYKIEDGDRVAIFKMGWKSLRSYVLFEWAVDSPASLVNSVTFSCFDLPTTATDDLYQFCYISGENVVQGVSAPFQIYSATSKPAINLTDSLKNENQCAHLKHVLSLKDKEILKLKEENAILKESLKAIVDQRRYQQCRSYDEDINELKETVRKMRSCLVGQQKEIDALKIEVKKDKAEYKNLMLEKIIAEKKFEAISNKKEAAGVQRTNLNFDLSSLEPIPTFPFQGRL